MFNWLTLLIGGLGLYAGYKLQQIANEKSEKKIIEALTLQIKELADKLQSGRSSGGEQGKMEGLQEALSIIQTKK